MAERNGVFNTMSFKKKVFRLQFLSNIVPKNEEFAGLIQVIGCIVSAPEPLRRIKQGE